MDTIDRLLSNRDKKLGELDDDLRESLIGISASLNIGDLDYDTLRKYIKSKTVVDDIQPGTVGHILVGCAGKEGTCVLGGGSTSDTSYVYDEDTNHITRVSGVGIPTGEHSQAIIHTLGDPEDIDLDVFKKLDSKGFVRVKILKKNVGSSTAEEIIIDDLKKYIYSRPERLVNFYYIFALISIFATVGLIYRYREKIFMK